MPANFNKHRPGPSLDGMRSTSEGMGTTYYFIVQADDDGRIIIIILLDINHWPY